MTSTSSRSVRLTGPETGRGQASLWTAAAAPDHKLWTTLRGPVDPSRLPTCPLPLRRGRPPTTHQSHQSKERRLTPIPSRRAGTGEHRQALTGGPYLSIEVGHTGLSKAIMAPSLHSSSYVLCWIRPAVVTGAWRDRPFLMSHLRDMSRQQRSSVLETAARLSSDRLPALAVHS